MVLFSNYVLQCCSNVCKFERRKGMISVGVALYVISGYCKFEVCNILNCTALWYTLKDAFQYLLRELNPIVYPCQRFAKSNNDVFLAKDVFSFFIFYADISFSTVVFDTVKQFLLLKPT